MRISLRPHHFLCLKGYKGHNYNKSQTTSWDLISKILKEYPDSDVLIVNGKDDLCRKCPAILLNKKSQCRESSVNTLDNNVKKLLGLMTGKEYKFEGVMERLNKLMTPEKHENWCSFCAWWKKGLCRDSFKK